MSPVKTIRRISLEVIDKDKAIAALETVHFGLIYLEPGPDWDKTKIDNANAEFEEMKRKEIEEQVKAFEAT